MKNLLYILLFVPLFFVSSCEEEGPIHGCLDSQAFNYNPEAWIDNNSCEYAIVGTYAQGGIVFYVDQTGGHGLVVATEDLGQFNWGCLGEFVDGADGTSIGTGYQNTLDIVNYGCTNTALYGDMMAAQAALDAEINGYSDWYLPSIDELIEIYNTVGHGSPDGNIAGFQNTHFWSSSEHPSDNDLVWVFRFNNNSAFTVPKNFTYMALVIRSF